MSEKLVNVNLFPIRCLELRNESDQKELDRIMTNGTNHPYYSIQLSEKTASQNIIPFYYVPVGEFSEPPYSRNQVRLIKYKVIKRMEDKESGTIIIYGCPISSQ